jgi:crossover junction endodeoxyribonuclease RuvC
MIILGIDPGYDRLGIAIIEKTKKESLLYSECYTTPKNLKFEDRLVMIGRKVKEVIEKYSPTVLAIEKLYITKNQKTAMNVSESRGVIMYEAAQRGMKIYEFSPPEIKVAVTSDGKSDKNQVIKMVSMLINIPKEKAQDDEYDAIAVALTCSAQLKSFPQ